MRSVTSTPFVCVEDSTNYQWHLDIRFRFRSQLFAFKLRLHIIEKCISMTLWHLTGTDVCAIDNLLRFHRTENVSFSIYFFHELSSKLSTITRRKNTKINDKKSKRKWKEWQVAEIVWALTTCQSYRYQLRGGEKKLIYLEHGHLTYSLNSSPCPSRLSATNCIQWPYHLCIT